MRPNEEMNIRHRLSAYPRRRGSSPAHNGGHHQRPHLHKSGNRPPQNSTELSLDSFVVVVALCLRMKNGDAERISSACLRATNAALHSMMYECQGLQVCHTLLLLLSGIRK